MSANLKVILFDLGRVLMHIDFEAFPNALGLLTKEQREKYHQAQIRSTVMNYEIGKITTDEFLDELYQVFYKDFSREQIFNAYNEIIVNDNTEIISFVEWCKSEYQIAILSNTSPSHWEKVLRISSVVKLFTHTFTSFHLGAMKPEAFVYKKVCNSLNVEPNEILFIDDLKENVDGALNIGMKGIVYHNVLQITSEFTFVQKHLK